MSALLDFRTDRYHNGSILEPMDEVAMPNITLKSIPDDLYDRLKRAAEEHRRSLNSEILVCLETVLGTRRSEPEELLARLRAVRRTVGERPLADAEVTAAKRQGRP